MKRSLIIIFAAVAVGSAVFMFSQRTPKTTRYEVAGQNANVSQENGKQVVVIKAKGGYAPQQTVAKAGVPTIIRVQTSGTFDCSSALRIPSLNYSKLLPATGTTDIEVPAQAAGSTLKAICSMGMYNFSVDFKG